ncbi:MAG: hypothetical protein K6U87_01635 [Firmicutes bacterium]|nr:hypothetical protein [Bacillota bacterium]
MGNPLAAVGLMLGYALLAPGGQTPPSWQWGQEGAAVATTQLQLQWLGSGPSQVTGRMDQSTVAALADYAARMGRLPTPDALSQAIATTTPSPGFVQDIAQWLESRGLGKPPGGWQAFQRSVGITPTGKPDRATLLTAIHLRAIAVAAAHRWPYQAQAGDSWSLLAWAANLPEQVLEANNPLHGGALWIGQTVRWPAADATTGGPATPQPPNATFAGLRPLGALIFTDLTPESASRLAAVEGRYRLGAAVAISGTWGLLHPNRLKALVQAGTSFAVTGFSDPPMLSQLPLAGVRQELQWGTSALATVGAAAAYVWSPQPSSAVKEAVQASKLFLLPASLEVRATGGNWSQIVEQAVLSHPGQLVSVSLASAPPKGLSDLFAGLKARGVVLESLSQIWAGSSPAP